MWVFRLSLIAVVILRLTDNGIPPSVVESRSCYRPKILNSRIQSDLRDYRNPRTIAIALGFLNHLVPRMHCQTIM